MRGTTTLHTRMSMREEGYLCAVCRTTLHAAWYADEQGFMVPDGCGKEMNRRKCRFSGS